MQVTPSLRALDPFLHFSGYKKPIKSRDTRTRISENSENSGDAKGWAAQEDPRRDGRRWHAGDVF